MAPPAPLEMTLLPGAARAARGPRARAAPARRSVRRVLRRARAAGRRARRARRRAGRPGRRRAGCREHRLGARRRGHAAARRTRPARLPAALPLVEDAAVSGTTAAGLVHAIEDALRRALAAIPYARPVDGAARSAACSSWPRRCERPVDADREPRHAPSVGRGATRRGSCSTTCSTEALDGPPPDWEVGHFACVVGRTRGPGGSLYGVADTYPSLGRGGVHLQPRSTSPRRSSGADMPAGGVIAVVAFAEDAERCARARSARPRRGACGTTARSRAGTPREPSDSCVALVVLRPRRDRARALAVRLRARARTCDAGVGWVPANHALTRSGRSPSTTRSVRPATCGCCPTPTRTCASRATHGASAAGARAVRHRRDRRRSRGSAARGASCATRWSELEREFGARADGRASSTSSSSLARHAAPRRRSRWRRSAAPNRSPRDVMGALDEAGAQPERFFAEFARAPVRDARRPPPRASRPPTAP